MVTPSQSGPSLAEKVSLYLETGVRMITVVDPERRTVPIYRLDGRELLLSENDTLHGEDVLPGFRLPVAEIFA